MGADSADRSHLSLLSTARHTRVRLGAGLRGPDPVDIDLWRVRAPADTASLLRILDGEERARADRYRREQDRSLFVAARAVVRGVLADALHANPEDLVFERGAQGKPRLGGRHVDSDLAFNGSHSGEWVLVALVRGLQVGVDIEKTTSGAVADAVSANVLSADEARAVRALPAAEQAALFTRVWTRKEAVLKAVGCGLSAPMEAFRVGTADGAEPREITFHAPDGREHDVCFRDVQVPTGYAAAVAVSLITD